MSQPSEVSRRTLLTALGLAGAGTTASGVTLTGSTPATAAPKATASAAGGRVGNNPVSVPPVSGLHLQFGDHPATQMTISWHTRQPVANPLVLLIREGSGKVVSTRANVKTYADAKSGELVYAQHAAVSRLRPDTDYIYAAVHDGASPQFGTFRTAPLCRAPFTFTFTSFGDQGTPTVGKRYAPPAGVSIANPPFVNDNLGSPSASDTTAGVERVGPLLHLFNGDLC